MCPVHGAPTLVPGGLVRHTSRRRAGKTRETWSDAVRLRHSYQAVYVPVSLFLSPLLAGKYCRQQ